MEREGRELHCVFPDFLVSDDTEHELNWTRFRGEESESGLWSF